MSQHRDDRDDRDGHTVGEVAALAGVSVRTLHHYDEIALVQPSRRTAAGYREYSADDLTRLRDVLAYRELGFALGEIAEVLDGDADEVVGHLRRQHDLLRARIARLTDVLTHVETMMEAHQMGIELTPAEQFEVFGPDWPGEQYAAEAEQRWGQSPQWRQSRQRTARFGKDDWRRITDDQRALEAQMAQALRAGVVPTSDEAGELAERHRLGVERFYDCPYTMHRALAEMYLADPRFTRHYEDVATGLAQWLHDAVQANADAREVG